MRASFHCAGTTPCSAAYSSCLIALSFCPSRIARAPERNASSGVIGTDGAANAVGGGSGLSSAGAAGATDTAGTGARGRGSVALGRPTAEPAPERGIDPGGRGTSTARLFVDAGIIPCAGAACAGASAEGRVVPSNANACVAPSARPTASMRVRSRVRIADFLGLAARMGHGAVDGGPDLLGVFPQISGGEIGLARLPAVLPPRQLLIGERDVDRAVDGIDGDHVAVAQQRDRSAKRRLGADMADAKATRRAGEAPIGDERNLAAGALPGQRRRGREHLAHAGAAARALVADDEYV